jgi:ATP-dependent DNA ligase
VAYAPVALPPASSNPACHPCRVTVERSRLFHEINLDGFRLMVRRKPAGVRLLTRNGIDWSDRRGCAAHS